MKNHKVTVISIILVLISIVAINNVLGNQTGGVSGLVKIVGVGGAIIAFFKPKFGMYIVLIESCYLDYIKKLATFNGTASTYTVVEVLSMSMLTLGLLGLGLLMRVMMSGRGFQKKEWKVIFVGLAFGAYIIGSYQGIGAVQQAVNGAGILIVTLCMSVFFERREEYFNFARATFWILMPWALLGLWQYFVGYSEMTIWYSNTSLSVINQPLDLLEAINGYRMPVGFGSNKANYTIVGYLYLFALWHAVTFKRNRALYVIAFLIAFVAIYIAASRTALFLPIIMFIVYLMMKTKVSRRVVIFGVVAIIPVMILISTFLMNNMANINDSISTDGTLSGTMTFGTFTERLVTLKELNNPDVWTLTGFLGSDDVELTINDVGYSHSMLASILYKFGVLGLLVAVSTLIYVVMATLKAVDSVTDYVSNRTIVYVFVQILLIIVMTLIGGSNLHVQPFNIWLAVMVGLALGMLPSTKQSIKL